MESASQNKMLKRRLSVFNNATNRGAPLDLTSSDNRSANMNDFNEMNDLDVPTIKKAKTVSSEVVQDTTAQSVTGPTVKDPEKREESKGDNLSQTKPEGNTLKGKFYYQRERDGQQKVFIYEGNEESSGDVKQDIANLKIEHLLCNPLSPEDSMAAIKAEAEGDPESCLRNMIRIEQEDYRRMIKAYRKSLNPKIERYYYEEYKGEIIIVIVYDDGYEKRFWDRNRDDKGLKAEGWKPITNEESLAAKKAAEEDASDPYLIFMTKLINDYVAREGHKDPKDRATTLD